MGVLPAAPPVSSAVLTNLSDPPIAFISLSPNGRKAPVACRDAAQVLPMLSTSGPWPEVTAVWMRVCRSFQPITSSLTLMPVCLVKSFRTGVSTCLSLSRLVPWLLAQ